MKYLIIIFLSLSSLIPVSQADTVDKPEENKVLKKNLVLPIRFLTLILDDAIYDNLIKFEELEKLEKNIPGTPISLLVTMKTNSTAGGSMAEASSGFLAASTLGIVPIVSNKTLSIRYELLVNKKKYVEINFDNNFTDTSNLFNNDRFTIKDPKIKDWVMSTLPLFYSQLIEHPRYISLKEEYFYYYGEKS